MGKEDNMMMDSVKRVIGSMRPVAGVFLLAAGISAHAQTTQAPATPAATPGAAPGNGQAASGVQQPRFRKEYVLGAGDQIEVVVRRVQEASRTLVIRPDGYITLPMVNEVKASGLTPPELSATLTQLLSTRLVDPEVTVIAQQIRPAVVYVVGDVANPTPIPLRSAATAMQAIGVAGGLRRTAAARSISIIRLDDEGFVRAIPIGVASRGQRGPYEALSRAVLQADDVIFVPESGRSQLNRFLDDFVNRPLTGVNSILATFVNFKLVKVFGKVD